MSDATCYTIDSLETHLWMLHQSHLQLTGKVLLQDLRNVADAMECFERAPFAIVSHGTEADPIFNYANATALRLFDMTWQQFTVLPSRKSAEAPNRSERARLLESVSQHGFIQHYSGVRVAASGRRFHIFNATVWNLHDGSGRYCGQAAAFADWRFIDEQQQQSQQQ